MGKKRRKARENGRKCGKVGELMEINRQKWVKAGEFNGKLWVFVWKLLYRNRPFCEAIIWLATVKKNWCFWDWLLLSRGRKFDSLSPLLSYFPFLRGWTRAFLRGVWKGGGDCSLKKLKNFFKFVKFVWNLKVLGLINFECFWQCSDTKSEAIHFCVLCSLL